MLTAMPALANNRRENFCQAVGKGVSAGQAYREAGYAGKAHVADVAASRLLTFVDVKARIAELQAKAAQKCEKTVASLVADLDRALAIAQQDRNPNAMVAAIVAQGKLLGLVIDKAQIETKAHRPAPEPDVAAGVLMSEDEWEQRLQRH